MVTKTDINKQCFLRFKRPQGEGYIWENVGARIAGFTDNKVIVIMPAGERVAVPIDDVRVLQPRPVE